MINTGKKFDVEYYLKFKAERIDACCQYEAQRLKLDVEIVKKHSIQEMRRKSEEYDDSMGTSGFIRFFTGIVYATCTLFVKNPEIYNGLLADRDIHKQTGNVNVDVVKILNDDRIDEEKLTIKLREIDASQFTQAVEKHKEGEKICADCEVCKPYHDFYRHKANKDGYSISVRSVMLPDTVTGMDIRKGATPHLNKPKPIEDQVSSFGFDNQEIDDMIQLLQPKLDIAKEDVIKAKQEVERIMQLITKLERRRSYERL